MSKRKGAAALGSSRRQRLDIANDDGQENAERDPIAAAIEDRNRRKEELELRLRAAAAKAAREAAAGVTTIFFDTNSPKRQGVTKYVDGSSSVATAAGTAPETLPASPENPLAALLGYSQEDSEGEGSEEDATERESAAPASGGEPGLKDDLDAELASFMDELESSGLLADTTGEAIPERSASMAPAASDNPVEQLPSAAEAEQPSVPDLAEEGGPDAKAEELAEEEASGPAEQRVLGELEGMPGWSEVMDMATKKVYFWCISTNEVAWSPPSEARPRTEQQAADAAAAAGTSSDTAATDAEAAPGAEPEAGLGAGPRSASHEAMEEGQILGSNEGRVEGQVAADGVVTAQPPAPERPSDEVQQRLEGLVGSLRSAAEKLSPFIPHLLRLAIEAEVRLADWQALAGAQSEAAASATAAAAAAPGTATVKPTVPSGGGMTWRDYEGYLEQQLGRLLGELPAALEEARLLSEGSEQAPEEGELVPQKEPEAAQPPLPPQEDEDMEIEPPGVGPEPAVSMPEPAASVQPPVAAVAARGFYAPVPSLPYALYPYHAFYGTGHGSVLALNISSGVGLSSPVHGPLLPPGFDSALDYPPLPSEPPPQSPSGPPPLPSASEEAGPPLPQTSSSPPPAAQYMEAQIGASAQQSVAPAAVPVRKKEYKAEPVLQYFPPAAELPTEEFAEMAQYTSEAVGGAAVESPAAGVAKREEKGKGKVSGVASSKKKKASSRMDKGTSQLFSKWAAVRKEVQDAESGDEDEVVDADALDRRRAQEAEEWRLEQLRKGVPGENANFQPLPGDWRQKVKGAGKKAAAGKQDKGGSSAEKEASAGAGGKPDLEKLSKGLPKGWRAMWDKNSKEVYYGNTESKKTSWERPAK